MLKSRAGARGEGAMCAQAPGPALYLAKITQPKNQK